LVNNAGVELVKPILEASPEDFASVFDLNVRGAYVMTTAVVPHLRAPRRVINISSVGADADLSNSQCTRLQRQHLKG